MSVRLEGTWTDGERNDYILEPIGPNTTRVRIVRKGTNNEVNSATLWGDASEGLMKGEIRHPDRNYASGYRKAELRAWVTDQGHLRTMNMGDVPSYSRLSAHPDAAAAKAWTGRWRTNRGLLTVQADGFNFVAWLTQPGGNSERRDRVAFRATPKEATGAWDSEYDRHGTWRHVPMQWGDLKLALSADGNSFTGTYTITKATMGLERREWTGERVDKLPVQTGPQPQLPPSGPVSSPAPTAPSPTAGPFTPATSNAASLASGEYLSDGHQLARAILLPQDRPGVVGLRLYGVENGQSKSWFGVNLQQTADGRELVGSWRDDQSGFLFATVRVTPSADGSAVRIAFDPGMDSIAQELMPKLYLGTFRKSGAAGSPAPQPAGSAPPSSTPTGSSPPQPTSTDPSPVQVGFKRLAAFDVRLDKVAAEDGRFWHVYMTLRNASHDVLVQAQNVTVRLEDSDGVGVESGQAVRAKPGYPELFGSPPPTTRPGGTLPVKFVFDKRKGARPSRVVVYEGEASAEFGF
jgi:hypothetical protein